MFLDRFIIRLKRALWYVPNMIQAKLDPVGYAKRLGVRMKGKVIFTGRPNFGTEPYLISLGDNVTITGSVQFLTHDGSVRIFRKTDPDLRLFGQITVGDDVFLGYRSILLPGAKIGNRCIIAAGAVVAGEIPDNSVAAGVPARVIKSADEYLESARTKTLDLKGLRGKKRDAAIKKAFDMERFR